MLLSLIQTAMWRRRLLIKRCKYCRYVRFIWGDPSRCRCAITWEKVDLEGPWERIFCKWFKAREDNIDI